MFNVCRSAKGGKGKGRYIRVRVTNYGGGGVDECQVAADHTRYTKSNLVSEKAGPAIARPTVDSNTLFTWQK